MLQDVRRYLALDNAERWLVMRAFVWLMAMDIILRVVSLRRFVRRNFEAAPVTVDLPQSEDIRRAQYYAHWLEIVSRHHIVRARCLHRSLVLNQWLRREGVPSNLRIGVRKAGDALKAHAWVEFGGQVVTDPPAVVAAFAPLGPLGAHANLMGALGVGGAELVLGLTISKDVGANERTDG